MAEKEFLEIVSKSQDNGFETSSSLTISKSENLCSSQKKKRLVCIRICLCVAIFLQSMIVNGGLSMSLSTIQRAFEVNDVQCALIDSSYTISFGIGALTLGLLVQKRKIRWIGSGCVFMAIGCIIFILPVFLQSKFEISDNKKSILCEKNRSTFPNEQCMGDSKFFLLIMAIGYVFIGFGASKLHTLAISYAEERTSPKHMGLFLGLYYSCASLGPVCTFLLFNYFSNFQICLKKDTHAVLTPESENWIGAYWLVYVVGGISLATVSLPLLLIPSVDSRYKESSIKHTKSSQILCKEFCHHIKMLIFNSSYIFVCMGMFCDAIVNSGISFFLIKLIETQFQLSSKTASLYGGSISVPGTTLGLITGGFFVRYAKTTTRRLILFTAIFTFITAILLSFLFIHCETRILYGVKYDPSLHELKFSSELKQCAEHCSCNLTTYHPVCVENYGTYFSPCLIGCGSSIGMPGKMSYHDCKCIPPNLNEPNVIQGSCDSGCKLLPYFIAFGLPVLALEFFIYIPLITVTMALLDRAYKQSGVAIQQLCLRCAYFIGPIFYSFLINLCCRVFFHSSDCSNGKSCINYNLKYLAFSVAIPSISLKLISGIFLSLAVWITPPNV